MKTNSKFLTSVLAILIYMLTLCYSNTKLIGWIDDSPTFSTLDVAKTECANMEICSGVTLSLLNTYELRSGAPMPSTNEDSWLKQVTLCTEDAIDIDNTILIDDGKLQLKYPEIKLSRYMSTSLNCEYHYPYDHLNSLFHFSSSVTFNVVTAPVDCPVKIGDAKLVIFGIKSMPGNRRRRDAIRETWQWQQYWIDYGIIVKTVFIVGQDKYFPIQSDERIRDDILELDFEESHYSLPLKGMVSTNCKFCLRPIFQFLDFPSSNST